MVATTADSLILKPLRLHSSETRSPKHRVSAAARSLGHRDLELTFEIENSKNVLWPELNLAEQKAERKDGLWRSTCLELFIGGSLTNYSEWNFSPNGNWAAYSFSDYRVGMKETVVQAPVVHESTSDLRRKYSILLRLPERPPTSFLNYSLTAVVLEKDELTPFCWAIQHSGSKPDFHLRDSFVLKMEF